MLVGDSPLHAAARRGHAEVVGVLLKAGCDMNKAGGCSATPLYGAARNGHAAVVEALVTAGCDVDKPAGRARRCMLLLSAGTRRWLGCW